MVNTMLKFGNIVIKSAVLEQFNFVLVFVENDCFPAKSKMPISNVIYFKTVWSRTVKFVEQR